MGRSPVGENLTRWLDWLSSSGESENWTRESTVAR